MKRFIMVSAMFLMLGVALNAQVIKTQKANIDKKTTTTAVAVRVDATDPTVSTKPKMVRKTMVVKRNQLLVSKKVKVKLRAK